MNTAVQTLTVVLGIATLASLAFGAWQLLQGANREATIKRLRAENSDYLQRLNYIEPKHRALEQQVDVLIALHDPSAKLDDLKTEHAEMLPLLRAIKTIAEQIDRRLYAPRGERNDPGPG